jgi:purine-cytosine permease-like protein
MNNAGLPGTGIGGLFYLLLALSMPFVEASRALRGRSGPGRWPQVITQFTLACGVLATVGATAIGYLRLVDAPSPFGVTGTALLLAPVVLAGLLLAVIVVVLRIWARLVERR